MIARSYPNNVFETLGLWTERPARELVRFVDVQVISPVPYCPPLPRHGRLAQYARFRDVARYEDRGGIKVHRPRFLTGPGSSLQCVEHRSYSGAVARAAAAVRREFAFDLIHAHFVYPDAVAAWRLSRRYRVPFLITDQAPWHPWLERPCVRKWALRAARDATHLTAVSGYLRDTIIRYLGAGARVHVIPNGVDEDEFFPSPPSERAADQILFVGFVNFNKGIDVLLEAMLEIRQRRPSARLLLAGGSFYRNTRLEEGRLRQLAVDLGVSDSVEFLGRRAPDEVARLMRQSAVVVLPSRAETFGAVLVEALASGTPVVATRSGGPDDIVSNGVGHLVPVEDSAALAASIVDVLEHPERYDADELRSYALERFRWSAVAGEFAALYRDAVEQHQATKV